MARLRTILFKKTIDNNYTADRDSIVVPSNVRRIVSICPCIVNGEGFISVFTETNEECLLNQMSIADNNAHFNKKNIEIFTLVDACNMYYVLELSNTDTTKSCILKILITYEEEEING